jgi:hypothetical protein
MKELIIVLLCLGLYVAGGWTFLKLRHRHPRWAQSLSYGIVAGIPCALLVLCEVVASRSNTLTRNAFYGMILYGGLAVINLIIMGAFQAFIRVRDRWMGLNGGSGASSAAGTPTVPHAVWPHLELGAKVGAKVAGQLALVLQLTLFLASYLLGGLVVGFSVPNFGPLDEWISPLLLTCLSATALGAFSGAVGAWRKNPKAGAAVGVIVPFVPLYFWDIHFVQSSLLFMASVALPAALAGVAGAMAAKHAQGIPGVPTLAATSGGAPDRPDTHDH